MSLQEPGRWLETIDDKGLKMNWIKYSKCLFSHTLPTYWLSWSDNRAKPGEKKLKKNVSKSNFFQLEYIVY